MDQHGEEEERSSQQESSDQRRRKSKDDAAEAVPEGIHGESSTADQRDDGGYVYEAETVGVIKEQVVQVVEQEASAPLLAHACSLLHLQLLLLLRACAGSLVGLLHGYCSDNNDPKPTADDVALAAVAESSPPEVEVAGDDDDKAAGAGSEVASQVLAARRPPPPGPPEEGSGGHGGNHN